MADDGILLSRGDRAPTARVELGDGRDAAFRSRLEAGLESGYRLASVILGNPGDAEDATHDAVERAWRSRMNLRDPERFEAWFQRIVVNACRDRLRQRRSAPSFVSVDTGVRDARFAARDRASDPYSASADRDVVRQALGRLNPDQRVVIAMRFYLDLEIDEIARRLGARSGTVKSRLHRALKQLHAGWEAER